MHPLIDLVTHMQAIFAGGIGLELPETHGIGGGHHGGAQAALLDGEVLEVIGDAGIGQGLFDEGHVLIAALQHLVEVARALLDVPDVFGEFSPGLSAKGYLDAAEHHVVGYSHLLSGEAGNEEQGKKHVCPPHSSMMSVGMVNLMIHHSIIYRQEGKVAANPYPIGGRAVRFGKGVYQP